MYRASSGRCLPVRTEAQRFECDYWSAVVIQVRDLYICC